MADDPLRLRVRDLIDALGPDLVRQVRDSALAYLTQTAIALGE